MNKFIIHKPEVEGKKAFFKYSIKTENNAFNFKEEHIFDFNLKDDVALKNLCIATSISYYKLHLANVVYVDWFLSSEEKEFWQWIFRNGFSELVYKNQLDWSMMDNIFFESEGNTLAEKILGVYLAVV
jgi:hypothetical protein